MFGQQLTFITSKPVAQPKSGFSWNSFLDDTTNPGRLVKRGQRVNLSGVVRFVKKEKGWSVDGLELTKADLAGAEMLSQCALKLQQLRTALDTFRLNIGRYPSAQEGLDALVVKPNFEERRLNNKWQGPYLKLGSTFNDPWGQTIRYDVNYVADVPFSLYSLGPDGKIKTADDVH